MTSRLPGFSRAGRPDDWSKRDGTPDVKMARARQGAEPATEPHLRVDPGALDEPVALTPRMVDEAVEEVVRDSGMAPEVAAVFQSLLSRDIQRGPAHAYFVSHAAARRKRVGPQKLRMTIPYALGDDDLKSLVEYAPDFELSFVNSSSHDHPMAAANRLIDHAVVMARLPTNIAISDVGGNPITHALRENAHVHVCGPTVDAKDSMRHVLRNMEASRLKERHLSETTRGLAAAYLSRDEKVVCDQVAQKCRYKATAITAVHVYDIPLTEWPRIMMNKGATVVEGCLLYSDQMYHDTVGQLGMTKARYEIDVRKDEFRMGFVNSPAMWYSHKWSQYLLYGTSQTLVCDGYKFAYSVVERRGDTLFFRILRMVSDGQVPRQRTLRMPGVPMVKVMGFALSNTEKKVSGRLRRQSYTFPRNLWQEMVSQASEAFERGMLDFNSMYNHYRTISVRQTINAVLVMGGERVDRSECVPLVVHACLAAAAMAMLGQRESRAMTQALMLQRMKASQTSLRLVFSALGGLLKETAGTLLYLFKAVTKKIDTLGVDVLAAWVLDWEPVQTDVLVPIDTLTCVSATSGTTHLTVESMFRDSALETGVIDHLAAVFSDDKLCKALMDVCPHVEAPELADVHLEHQNRSAKTPVVEVVGGGSVSTEPPTYATGPDANALTAARQAAVLECIREIELQNAATETVCARAYNELCIKGTPLMSALKSRFELYRNPDLWLVRNGVIRSSASGIPISDFNHMAVYSPRPDPSTGSCIRSITETVWEGVNSDGEPEKHVNYEINDSLFSGYVLVTDDLAVYNGPEILSSLHVASQLRHDYAVVLHEGPPGCGKTYLVVHEANPDGSDVIMCPVRESISDTRTQLLKLHPKFRDAKLKIRTVDSFLVNRGKDDKTRLMQARRLLADECFMTHAGKWYAVAALLGVESIEAYGDAMQIPHIPRVEAPKLHVKIKSSSVDSVWTTRRCPATAVAAWGSVYEWKVRTLSGVANAPMKRVENSRGLEIPDGCVMMCMYQADKITLRRMYSQSLSRIKVLTAHESEGKTFKTVWLHRFDNRRRTDKFSLFDQQPHVLVAMSRHTHAFIYVCQQDLGDLVCQWISRSSDARRLAAVCDVKSAGKPMEKM